METKDKFSQSGLHVIRPEGLIPAEKVEAFDRAVERMWKALSDCTNPQDTKEARR